MSSSLDVALVAWPNHPKRWWCFQQTLAAWKKLLTAGPFPVNYVCSSESARDPKHQFFGVELQRLCEQEGVRLEFRGGPPGLGENMNAALRMCKSNFIILAQDDRPPIKPLDVEQHIRFLASAPNVAMIRYGWPQGRDVPTGKWRTRLMGHPSGFRQFDINGPWPYGDEPHLRHRSFMDRFGWYRENVRHGASEGIMLWNLVSKRAVIIAADEIYCGHNGAGVPAVIDDARYPNNLRDDWKE